MKQKGNISIMLLCGLLVIFAGTAISLLAVNGKYEAKTSYLRMENRYIAESGVDTAIGLFQNYLENQEYILTYTKNEDGSYSVIDSYSPYLLDEIRDNDNKDEIPLELIEAESNSYLSSIGFLDFSRSKGIEISINTFSQKQNFKLSQMCTQPLFLVEREIRTKECRSKINPIYLTVKAKYKGGEVLCNAEVSDIYVVREPFRETEVSELSSVKAHIDLTNVTVKYNNYQNYLVKAVIDF